MLNTEDFIKRLEILFEQYGLTAASFSDKIGVQRSGVSHLLSGRNKPSLDFILKIIAAFPEVDLYWLVTGQGNMTKYHNTRAPIKELRIDTITNTEKIIIFHTDGTFSEYRAKK